jgi:hypothetical protein
MEMLPVAVAVVVVASLVMAFAALVITVARWSSSPEEGRGGGCRRHPWPEVGRRIGR